MQNTRRPKSQGGHGCFPNRLHSSLPPLAKANARSDGVDALHLDKAPIPSSTCNWLPLRHADDSFGIHLRTCISSLHLAEHRELVTHPVCFWRTNSGDSCSSTARQRQCYDRSRIEGHLSAHSDHLREGIGDRVDEDPEQVSARVYLHQNLLDIVKDSE